MNIQNAKSLPKVFYGLHMVEGLAEYAEPNAESFRIYIGEEAIKNMNVSFQGKPVFVDHVESIDLDNLEREMDGVVVDSFFNKSDGKNWVKFVVFTDRAFNAISQGWRLSNAYIPKSYAQGGENHGVRYDKEVTSGEYEHLAIVPNPRYEESIILTPEQFKEYNLKKEQELARLANSKEENGKKETKMKLNFFRRTKIANDKESELAGLMVELPKSKKEMELSQIIQEFDALQNASGYAQGEHMVKVGDEDMTVNDLVKKHMEMCNKMKKKNDGEGEPGMDMSDSPDLENESEAAKEGAEIVGDRGGDVSLSNEEEEMEEIEKKKKKENEAEGDKPASKPFVKNSKSLEQIAATRAKALALKNAGPDKQGDLVQVIDLPMDKLARGKARYGSGK